jgi:hypothetical protein
MDGLDIHRLLKDYKFLMKIILGHGHIEVELNANVACLHLQGWWYCPWWLRQNRSPKSWFLTHLWHVRYPKILVHLPWKCQILHKFQWIFLLILYVYSLGSKLSCMNSQILHWVHWRTWNSLLMSDLCKGRKYSYIIWYILHVLKDLSSGKWSCSE